ncbi:MAG: hypothetical protein NZ893_00245 [Candidatus Aenigmarchaeota archaeon]|nr:hypothetical protein [Candidatus Aenigmarchaeota archaeon]
MYEPYEDKRGSPIKRFFEKLKDKWEAFKQELHFDENSKHKWILVFIPLVLIALFAVSYTGYVTYTGKITEAQSRVLVMEKQMATLETELAGTKTELEKCSSDLSKTRSDLESSRKEIERSQKNVDTCVVEKQELKEQIRMLQDSYDELNRKFATLESNYKSLECNWAQSKNCIYYVMKNNNIECVIKIGEKYYTIPVGLEVSEKQVKTC